MRVLSCHRWTYQGKRRKAWGIRYRIDGGELVRKIVADTKDGADAELEKVKEQYRCAQSGLSDGKTFAELAPLFLAFKEQMGRGMEAIR